MGGGWVLGIESTAHTFSFGAVTEDMEPIPSSSSIIRPTEGGIHPREAADHHSENASLLLQGLLSSNSLSMNNLVGVAYSQGPGLGPCLRVGASVARAIATARNVPLIGVNHCVAHIEIGRTVCGCDDPVLLYVSGGNTQVITRLDGRYRVLGETMDIGIGNMLDKFARHHGYPFPGGPEIEKAALRYRQSVELPSIDGLELPYAVQGMDLAFSGLLNAADTLVEKGTSFDAVCWSLQEHAFAASIEVAERALAHTGKTELLLGGGVACNERIREMSDIMCLERGATAHWPPKMYCIDNGTMIALLGLLQLESIGPTELIDSAVDQMLRTDMTPVAWA
ncbi:MAG: UGMP family protein [Euryarchaeota archaeon]|nr:UGMP family protein [Euryarchaeota archaeon]